MSTVQVQQRDDHGVFIPIHLRTQHESAEDNRYVAAPPSPTSVASDGETNNNPDDPYEFGKRFIANQKTTFRTAVKEIKNGKKETHWFWFILPTPPYVVNGVEQGSRTNRYFTLRDDEEVKAYLEFEKQGVNLRDNYITILTEIKAQLKKGKTLEKLLGPKNAPKAVSSFCLFERIAQETSDAELYALCVKVLALDEKNRQNFKLFKNIVGKLTGKSTSSGTKTPSKTSSNRSSDLKMRKTSHF
jgi:uncharacterized protein (DUF1810 family)